MKIKQWMSIAIASLLLLSGCTGGDPASKVEPSRSAEPDTPPKPVELRVTTEYPTLIDTFNAAFTPVLKNKYPHITFTLELANNVVLDQMIASGQTPDVIIGSDLNGFKTKMDRNLAIDLNPLIQKHKFDLNRIEPNILRRMQSHSQKGELLGISYAENLTVLYYNKALFDKFGVAYPKDNIMWSEVVDLAKRLTRYESGEQYYGMFPETITRIASTLGRGYIDPVTEKPQIQALKPAFEIYKEIMQIPGNIYVGFPTKIDITMFYKMNNIAMQISPISLLQPMTEAERTNGLQWDMVTFPQFPDHKGVYGLGGGFPLMITPTAKDKDAAFKLIEVVFSDEGQTALSKMGSMPVLKNTAIQKVFGENLYKMSEKNIQALFKLKSPVLPIHPYDNFVANQINIKHMQHLLTKDTNTLIRDIEEDILRDIAAEKAK